jgi:predicted NBD/HSP70 family sugar kinase
MPWVLYPAYVAKTDEPQQLRQACHRQRLARHHQDGRAAAAQASADEPQGKFVIANGLGCHHQDGRAAASQASASSPTADTHVTGSFTARGRPPLLPALGRVFVCEDASAHLVGELEFGPHASRLGGSSATTAVLVCVGTGVGTAVSSGGRLLRGASGLVEGGHIVTAQGEDDGDEKDDDDNDDDDQGGASGISSSSSSSKMSENATAGVGHAARRVGRRCGCGQRGCAERYASAPAIVARANRAAAEGAGAAAGAFADCGVVFSAVRRGDAAANSAVQVAAEHLARMCLSLARALDPHVFLFAGGLVLGRSSGTHGSACSAGSGGRGGSGGSACNDGNDSEGSGDGNGAAWFLKQVEARYRALDWRVGDAVLSEGVPSSAEGRRRGPRGPLFLTVRLAGAAALRGAVELACAAASPT